MHQGTGVRSRAGADTGNWHRTWRGSGSRCGRGLAREVPWKWEVLQTHGGGCTGMGVWAGHRRLDWVQGVCSCTDIGT